jgi:hypothetical protein
MFEVRYVQSFTESTVEQATLAWLESAGWAVRNGTETAPGEAAADRDDYGQVVLAPRLRDTLLPNFISGELWVTDAERFVGEVV